LVHFIIDVVAQLDLFDIYSSYDKNTGQPPYDPTMMTALLLYAYCIGVPSSRQIEKRTYEDVAFRMITANRHPDHDSICAFRKGHLQALAALVVHVLDLCQEASLVRLGQVALDGTKVRANASKPKAMSHGRMKKAKEELEQEIAKHLEEAETVDAHEDARYGKGQKGWNLPKEGFYAQTPEISVDHFHPPSYSSQDKPLASFLTLMSSTTQLHRSATHRISCNNSSSCSFKSPAGLVSM
jgi:transposase